VVILVGFALNPKATGYTRGYKIAWPFTLPKVDELDELIGRLGKLARCLGKWTT
jgi:hypothetical protein